MTSILKYLLFLTAILVLAACDQAPPKNDGESIYYRSCFSCHERGHGGAPLRGNIEQWQARLDKGEAALMKSMVEGYKTMPPKGGCFDCTEADLQKAFEFMLKPKAQ
ncbi:c-type cytochrome [Kangiella taiwanensis]|uniref:Cytochrome c domain-containing protein n=1 Tax=Kangiella taiwanensis TaxID=1079179 RepID=A0ABP8HXM4_9GAMM|nr:c-type cytochrome [Kangiella taiwanensis]